MAPILTVDQFVEFCFDAQMTGSTAAGLFVSDFKKDFDLQNAPYHAQVGSKSFQVVACNPDQDQIEIKDDG